MRVSLCRATNILFGLPDFIETRAISKLIDDDSLLSALLDSMARKDVNDEHLLVLPFFQIFPQLISEFIYIFALWIVRQFVLIVWSKL